MKFKLVTALALALFSVNSYAQSKGVDTKPVQFDFDSFYSDACYMSNCANPPRSATATAVVQQRAVNGGSYQFRTFQPAYTPPATCTSVHLELVGGDSKIRPPWQPNTARVKHGEGTGPIRPRF